MNDTDSNSFCNLIKVRCTMYLPVVKNLGPLSEYMHTVFILNYSKILPEQGLILLPILPV